MKKLSILSILMSMTVISKAQQIPYEQLAVNYFADSLFYSNYTGKTTIEFNGYTENELSNFRLFNDCFQSNDSIKLELGEKAHNIIQKRKQSTYLKIKKYFL